MKWVKIFAETFIGAIILAVFLTIFVDPESFQPTGIPLGSSWFEIFLIFGIFSLCPLAWFLTFILLLPSWLVGWVVFAFIGQIRSSGEKVKS